MNLEPALLNRYFRAVQELTKAPSHEVRMYASELLGSIHATQSLDDLRVLMDPRVPVYGVENLVRIKVRQMAH